MLDDGLGSTEGIRSDPEDHRIASAQDACCVSEHVRSAFEHEPDHSQTIHHLLEAPSGVGDFVDHPATARRCISPTLETGDHVRPHRVIEDQPRDGTPAVSSGLDIGCIRSGDWLETLVVRERGSEGQVEPGDLVIRHIAHPVERINGRRNGLPGSSRSILGNMEQFTGVLHDDQ
jgi:hypothetical protein